MDSHSLICPLKIVYGTSKKGNSYGLTLSLNSYNHAKGYVISKTKTAFKAKMEEQINALPNFNKIKITYYFYPANKLADLMNYVSVIDKFLQDALVEKGKIIDDKSEYVPIIHAEFKAIDKHNPRMEVIIEPL